MLTNLIKAFTIGAVAVGSVTLAHAQQNAPAKQNVDLGKWEYDAHCAACHGLTAKGDGFYAELQRQTPANLTELAKKNNGVYPFARVYSVIDGREETSAHGTRDMPIWGAEYKATSQQLSPYYDPEAFARAKILALTEYIYRLQSR